MVPAMRLLPITLATAALALTAACGGSAAQTAKDDNALGCDSARRHISDVQSTFADLGKGTITVTDAAKPIKDAQDNLTGDAGFSHASLQTEIGAVADDLGRVRVAMLAGGSLNAETPPLVAAMKAVDSDCTRLGH